MFTLWSHALIGLSNFNAHQKQVIGSA